MGNSKTNELYIRWLQKLAYAETMYDLYTEGRATDKEVTRAQNAALAAGKAHDKAEAAEVEALMGRFNS